MSILEQYKPQGFKNLDTRICLEGSCFANLPATILEPGPGQRGQTSKTKQMCGEEKYNPLGFRPLSVSHGFVKKNGNEHEFFFITDGLQRYTAITKTFGTDVLIPCFITENLSEQDQKYALFLINHNASLFSDKAKLWQNAVESGRDVVRKHLTDMFTEYGIGIAGYDKDGNPITVRRHSNGSYFRPGDLIVQYVFGGNSRPPVAGGKRGFEIESEAVEYALKLMTSIWVNDTKRTDDILVLGLIYFYAKNQGVWKDLDDAVEKSRDAFRNKSVDDVVETALKVMRLKEALDTGKEAGKLSRFNSSWHGPACYVVLKRIYEKAFSRQRKLLFTGYSESSDSGHDAMFCFDKYKGIQKMLRHA